MGGCVKKNCNTEKWYAQARRGRVKCRLHPLIHTPLEFDLVQNIESLRERSRSSAVFFQKWIALYQGRSLLVEVIFCIKGSPFVLAVPTAEELDSVIAIDKLDEVIQRKCLVAL